MIDETKLEHIAADLRPLAVEVSALSYDPENAKTHEDIGAIKESLRAFGQRKPIVVNVNGMVAEAGNGTLEAFRDLGWEHIAVVKVDDDDHTHTAYALADNRSAEKGSTWNPDKLPDLVGMLKAETDFDLPALGLSDDDLAAMLADDDARALGGEPDPTTTGDSGGEVTEPATPDTPAQPFTEAGDVWILGDHRLVCGDSTESHTLDKALDGRTPAMVFTDPPYGVGYTPKATVSSQRKPLTEERTAMQGEKIENDATDDDALGVTRDALALLRNAPSFYVCTDWRHIERVAACLPIKAKACIVWDKRGPYQYMDLFAKRHEMIVYAGPYGGQKTVDTDIWEQGREFRHDHPTPKPVELVAKALRASSTMGDLVVDPFCGSGATLLAAEQIG